MKSPILRTRYSLATNKVLEEYESQIIGSPSASLTRIRVVSKDRIAAKKAIEDALTKENIDWHDALRYPKYQRGWHHLVSLAQ